MKWIAQTHSEKFPCMSSVMFLVQWWILVWFMYLSGMQSRRITCWHVFASQLSRTWQKAIFRWTSLSNPLFNILPLSLFHSDVSFLLISAFPSQSLLFLTRLESRCKPAKTYGTSRHAGLQYPWFELLAWRFYAVSPYLSLIWIKQTRTDVPGTFVCHIRHCTPPTKAKMWK